MSRTSGPESDIYFNHKIKIKSRNQKIIDSEENLMTNVLKGVFGNTRRIRILEELVENWSDFLTIEEIARIAEIGFI
jgi:hypothetical protein